MICIICRYYKSILVQCPVVQDIGIHILCCIISMWCMMYASHLSMCWPALMLCTPLAYFSAQLEPVRQANQWPLAQLCRHPVQKCLVSYNDVHYLQVLYNLFLSSALLYRTLVYTVLCCFYVMYDVCLITWSCTYIYMYCEPVPVLCMLLWVPASLIIWLSCHLPLPACTAPPGPTLPGSAPSAAAPIIITLLAIVVIVVLVVVVVMLGLWVRYVCVVGAGWGEWCVVTCQYADEINCNYMCVDWLMDVIQYICDMNASWSGVGVEQGCNVLLDTVKVANCATNLDI